jgi:hypothetical protein
MKKHWMSMSVLVVSLAAPVWGSAQATGHQHHQGQQQMQQMEHMQHMQHMEHMEQMIQRMGRMHEELQEMHHRLGHSMGHMMSMSEVEHLQHQHMRGMTEAMGQMAGQMRSAMTRMMEMAEGSATHPDAAMHQDMEELHGHMQQMTEGMEASLEVLLRMEKSMGGGGAAH